MCCEGEKVTVNVALEIKNQEHLQKYVFAHLSNEEGFVSSILVIMFLKPALIKIPGYQLV